jgi:hypothetical protein
MKDNFIRNNLEYLLGALLIALAISIGAVAYWHDEQLQEDHRKFVDDVSGLLESIRTASEFCEAHNSYLAISANMVDGKSQVEVECRK